MGTVLLSEQRHIEWSPEEVFDAFADEPEAGWLFGATCGRVQVGAPVRFTLPTNGFLDSDVIEVIGRLSDVRRGKRIVIEYEAPWNGRLTCVLRPEGRGTLVRLIIEVGDDAFRWFLGRRGINADTEPAPGLRIGLLTSKSGSASVFSAASENLARLAVEELNAEGGIERLPVHLIVGDDGTDPVRGVAAFGRLVDDQRCPVVVTNVTSATFRAVAAVAKSKRVLLVYTPVNEGGPESTLLIRLGERPDDQVRRVLPRLMRTTGCRTWFLAGNDYIWPRATNRRAKVAIERHGGQVLGEQYAPLGTRDFTFLLEEIERRGADLIVSTFVGADEVAFERQFYEAGLRDRCSTIALALDEATNQHIGASAGNGLWSAFHYFEHLRTPENTAFLRRYRERFGTVQPPVSSISESIYEAVKRVGASARAAHSIEPLAVGRELRTVQFDSPRGSGRGANSGEPPMLLAESLDGELVIRDSLTR